MMLPRKVLVCFMVVAVGFKERAYAGLASAAAGVRYTTAGLAPDSPSIINRRGRSSSLACSPIMRGPACGGWSGCAAVVPGDSIAGEVVVGGLLNFLNIYNILITGRVLLSWVPQLQGVEALQPVYLLTDPYLNVFRRLNLTFGGLDFSVLPAFFLLSFATNAVASLGAEIPSTVKKTRKLEGSARWWETRRTDMMRARREFASSVASTIVGQTSKSVGNDGATSTSRRRLFSFRP